MNGFIRNSSAGGNYRRNKKSEFTNPILRIWMNTHKYDDSEYMFYQLGNWPKQYMLNCQEVKNDESNTRIISLDKTSIKPKSKFSRLQIKTGKRISNPWLYKPHSKSLFRSIKKNSINMYL